MVEQGCDISPLHGWSEMVHTVTGGSWEHPDEGKLLGSTSIKKVKMECHIQIVKKNYYTLWPWFSKTCKEKMPGLTSIEEKCSESECTEYHYTWDDSGLYLCHPASSLASLE